MSAGPPRHDDVTCGSCGITLPASVAYRAGELGDNGWTCNVCLAGGIEAVLNQLPAKPPKDTEEGQ